MNKLGTPSRIDEDSIFQANTVWFWLALACSTSNMILLFVSDTSVLISSLRYVLGSVFVFWLPGYLFVRAFLPNRIPKFLGSDDSNIEAIALCIAISLALVTIIAFILNYTSWGITQSSIVTSLFVTTMLLSEIGMFRQYY